MRHLSNTVLATAAAAVMASAAMAQDARGVWVTQADDKGQTAHVEAKPCGGALCGTIIRTFDADGAPITTSNVGQRVFWDMASNGAGRYSGMAFVPAHNRNYRATLQVSGNEMLVRGCLGPICQSQLWRRAQ